MLITMAKLRTSFSDSYGHHGVQLRSSNGFLCLKLRTSRRIFQTRIPADQAVFEKDVRFKVRMNTYPKPTATCIRMCNVLNKENLR